MIERIEIQLATLRTKTTELERLAGEGIFNPEDWNYVIGQYQENGFLANAANLENKFANLRGIFGG